MPTYHNPGVQMLLWGYHARLEDWTCESGRTAHLGWRFYWNATPGAALVKDGVEHALTPEVFCVIPADTVFSSRASRPITHFCVHFDVGSPFDTIPHGIYLFPADAFVVALIKAMASHADVPGRGGASSFNLLAHALLYRALSEFRDSDFGPSRPFDKRVARVVNVLDANASSLIGNEALARIAGMSVNRFIGLFTAELGKSPQKYARDKRVAKASQALAFSDKPIDMVAEEAGFVDRYHFSKAFKAVTGSSPASFRRQQRRSLPPS